MAQASFAYCDDPLQTDKAALIQGARRELLGLFIILQCAILCYVKLYHTLQHYHTVLHAQGYTLLLHILLQYTVRYANSILYGISRFKAL